ncbi:MAG: DUF4349 domain-containing protein [Eubacteriales bacterium]
MQCSEIKEMLSAYIDDVLDERERSEVENHIRTCSICFQELTDLQETVNLLRTLGQVNPPEEFRDQLRERLGREAVPARKGSGGWHDNLRHWASGSKKYLAAAVIIVGLGVGAGLYSLSQIRMGSPTGEIALNSRVSASKAEDSSKNTTLGESPGPIVDGKGGSGGESSKNLPDLGRMKMYQQNGDYMLGSSPKDSVREIKPKTSSTEGESSSTSVEPGSANQLKHAPAGQVTGDTAKSLQVPAGIRNVEPTAEKYQDNSIKEAAPDTGISALKKDTTEQPLVNQKSPKDQAKAMRSAESVPAAKSEADQAAKTEEAFTAKSGEVPAVNDKIIRDGLLSVEVDSYKGFGTKLPILVEQYGGYIENSSENTGKFVTASFVIRVPARNFSELLNRIEALGKITDKQITGRDVSGEFIDAQSRLRNLQRQEQRLLELMGKTGTVSEVLTIETELGRVRGEIEVLQGRLKSLDSAVVYSTIRLEVREAAKPAVAPAQGVFGNARRNFSESVIAILNMLGDLVSFTGWLLPWALVVTAVGGAVYYLRKKGKKGSE